MSIDAIDCSHWQADIDFDAVAASGVVGCIHKATEGTGYCDPTYAERYMQALDCDLKWGAYHFLKAGNIPQQMNWFVDKAGLPEGSRMVIDYEDAPLTLDDLQQAIEELAQCDPTAQICVYCGGLLKGQVSSGKSYPWLEPTSLWLAHYTTGEPSWPVYIWPVWSLHQYSDKGTVPGVTGYVDVNRFNGSPKSCAKWFGPAGEPEPAPTPRPGPKTVSVNIDVPDGVTLMLSVNGELIVL